MTRRAFLGGAVGLAALAAGFRAAGPGSRVALVRGLRPNARWHEAQRAISLGIEKCVGRRHDAWLAELVAKGPISVKIDARSPLAHTQESSIIGLLQTLLEQGAQPRGIGVWDQRASDVLRLNLRLQTGSGTIPVRWVEAVNARGDSDEGYDADFTFTPGWLGEDAEASRYAALLNPPPAVLINMPAAKHHPRLGINGALASLALAAVNRTGRFLKKTDDLIRAVCEIWKGRPLGGHALTVLDATHMVFNGGPVGLPAWTAPSSSLIVGTDPVAVDSVALRLINGRRLTATLSPCLEAGEALLKSAEETGLGSADPEVVEVTLPAF